MSGPAAQPFPILASSSGSYGTRGSNNQLYQNQGDPRAYPPIPIESSLLIDTQANQGRPQDFRNSMPPPLPIISNQQIQQSQLPPTLPIMNDQNGNNKSRNGHDALNPFKGSMENIEPLPVFGGSGRDPNMPPPLPLLANNGNQSQRDPNMPPPLPLFTHPPRNTQSNQNGGMPSQFPTLPPTLPIQTSGQPGLPSQLPLLPPSLPIMSGGFSPAGSQQLNAPYVPNSGSSIRSEPSNLVKELIPLSLGDNNTHGSHRIVVRPHDQSHYIVKENRFDTKPDMQAVRDQYLMRQMIVHRNLAKLKEITLHEEIKLPLSEYVLRGYYEYFPSNLASIKQKRKESRVHVRERELMLVFMDG